MQSTEAHDKLNALIEEVPDFPKPGVVYKDFTPLLADPGALALAVEQVESASDAATDTLRSTAD